MKPFKFKTTMKLAGYRARAIQGIAFPKKHVTAAVAAEKINEKVSTQVRNDLKGKGELSESLINAIVFKTTVEALPVDLVFDLE